MWTRYQRIAISALVVAFVVCASAASAQMSGDVRKDILETLPSIIDEQDAEASARIFAYISEPTYSPKEWRDILTEVYHNRSFGARDTEVWWWAIRRTESTARGYGVASLAAAASLAHSFQPAYTASSNPPIMALERLREWDQYLSAPWREEVFSLILEASEGAAPGLIPSSGLPPVNDATAIAVGSQLSLTIADFTARNPQGRVRAADALGLVEPGRTFWTETGAFLLDNSALNEAQVRSLLSLATAIPNELHYVFAVAVPAGLQTQPTGTGFGTDGQILALEAIPMDATTDPREWQPDIPQPVAPLFTIRAAQQYVQAIQEVQFLARPELGVRLGTVIQKAGPARSTYLLRGIAQGRYVQNPAALLPDTAYLWFIDTQNTFRQAWQHWHITIKSPMDEFLLFADMMSGGSGRTVLYHTTPGGQVTSQLAGVGRVQVAGLQAPGLISPIIPNTVAGPLSYVNAIQLPARAMTFRLDSFGLVDSVVGP